VIALEATVNPIKTFPKKKEERMKIKKTVLTLFLVLLLPAISAAQERIKFPVSASSKVLGFAPLWVADKKGFFEREGLDAQVTVTRGTSPSMQALVAESIDAALAANDGPIGLVEKGVDIVMIAGASKTTHMILGGKGIKTYEDLRGKTIGSSTLTSGTAFLLRKVLKTKGLEYPRDYTLLSVGGSGPSFMALSAGKIDASILAVPISFKAIDSGLNLIGKVSDVFPNYLLSSFSVRRGWAAEHRDEVVQFLKALLKARKWIEDNPNDAAEFLAQDLNLNLKMARRGLDYYLENRAWAPDLGIDLEGLKPVIETYAEQSQMKGPVPGPEKFVDLSFLKEALKQLGWKTAAAGTH
jgi:ABC-type nitrate/sulfonate/bicarbonate transport system substrate-binding protein